ncbi:hypothetical protein EW093_01905 [Thiospirochaeta perfilievii]|uniref:A9CJY8-like N-terminal domain-containing protein n=1 Tax=Thiospirochaeta perfilievii TaxID=252967 RepID=A0A5C1QA27_9SPIO|nr:hypothetical protein [Thiospirochaeta perfilievii]QEN03504.1 hypothetical protein EW093_01905 [Thiospirochaeta perfilievii]
MKFEIIDKSFCLYRLDENRGVPREIYQSSFFNVTKTDNELTMICDEEINLSCCTKLKDLKLIKISDCEGFHNLGIIKKISLAITKNEVSFWIISSYEANHVVVLKEKIDLAAKSLVDAGITAI